MIDVLNKEITKIREKMRTRDKLKQRLNKLEIKLDEEEEKLEGYKIELSKEEQKNILEAEKAAIEKRLKELE
jgi:hypothetical protein